MEPMESYDEDMIKKERLVMVERGRDLDDQANECEAAAKKAKTKIAEIQKKLINLAGS